MIKEMTQTWGERMRVSTEVLWLEVEVFKSYCSSHSAGQEVRVLG